jgi:4-hydroxybenzoate polyprenyltransferase
MKARSIKPFSAFWEFVPERQLTALLVSAKPAHWTKNLLIFAALVFSGGLLKYYLLKYYLLTHCILGFGLFCIASSGVYIANDLFDRKKDRIHPFKQYRPIAAGLIDPTTALFWAIALQATALIGAFLLSLAFGYILLAYLLINAAYNLLFKKIALLDVFCVAFSLLLRAFAGAIIACAPMSLWLVGCTLALGLFMSLAKRRSEQKLLGVKAVSHRQSLKWYKTGRLDWLLYTSGMAVVIVYSIYAFFSETALQIGGDLMALTIPFVLFGVMRFFSLLGRDKQLSDPTRLVMGDSPLLINIFLWALSVILIIYGKFIL